MHGDWHPLCLFPSCSDAPFREFPWRQKDNLVSFKFSQCEVGEGIKERRVVCCGYLIHLPTCCMPCPVLLVPDLGLKSSLLLTLADSSSFSPQIQAPPCLQTPQPQARAQSPLCHLHSEESARHLSPSHPMEIKLPGTALPYHWDPSPAWRVHHYVRKAPPAPLKPPHHACQGHAFLYRIIQGLLFKSSDV